MTVTVGGKAPSYVTGNAPLTQTSVGAIQTAIDAASPGDLVILDATRFEGPPEAVIELPGRVPFGFHGSWVPAASLP